MNDYFKERTVVTERGCWEWTLSRHPAGYGQAKVAAISPRPMGAHRLSYLTFVGPIPDGMTVDHLCFNPPCVNPGHLRLLTLSENSRNQRDAHKDRCKRGHLFTPENTRVKAGGNGRRDCKTCHKHRERARWRAERQELIEKGLVVLRAPIPARFDERYDPSPEPIERRIS